MNFHQSGDATETTSAHPDGAFRPTAISAQRLDAVETAAVALTMLVIVASTLILGWLVLSAPMSLIIGALLLGGSLAAHELSRRDSKHVVIDLTD